MLPHAARRASVVAALALVFASAPGFADQIEAGQKGIAWARSGDAPVDAASAARLSALTNQVIAAIGEYRTSPNGARGQAGVKLRQLAQERKALLRSMLDGQPGFALRSTIPHGMTQNLPADIQRQLEQDIKVAGRIVALIADDFDLQTASTRYFVETADRQGRLAQFRLHAADRPDRSGVEHPASRFVGQLVTVRATAIDEELLIAGAQSIEAGSSGGSTESSTVIAEGALVSGNQNTLVLTAHFSDKSLSVSATDIYNKVFGATNSVADFYRQSSRGNVSFSGTMYGPFQLSVASTSACDFQNWSAQVENLASKQGINLASYPRRIFVFPSSTCGIGYGSVGSLPSRAWIFRADLLDLFTHEVGHNLGFQHSSTASNEYGDTSDVMGYSGMALRHNNAPNKVTTGWISSAWVRSVTGSGIFTLDPTASSSPVYPQVLTLAKPDTGDQYYISFRQPLGYDGTLSSSYQNRVSIHRGSSSLSQYTYLLGVLAAGGTYTDAANGYSFTVNSIGTTSATVSVTTTAAPCTRAAPSVSLSPVSQSAAPGRAISYQVTVRNNNSANCGATAFAFANSLPAGWSGSDSPALLSIDAGASASATWTITSAASAAQASYAVTTSVYDTAATSSASSAQGTYVVTALDTTPPTVAVTAPSNGAMLKGSKVSVAAAAADNVGVAKVEFLVNGVLTATDTSAPYSFNWNLRKVSTGAHSLTAKATDAAGNSASSTITVYR